MKVSFSVGRFPNGELSVIILENMWREGARVFVRAASSPIVSVFMSALSGEETRKPPSPCQRTSLLQVLARMNDARTECREVLVPPMRVASRPNCCVNDQRQTPAGWLRASDSLCEVTALPPPPLRRRSTRRVPTTTNSRPPSAWLTPDQPAAAATTPDRRGSAAAIR